MRIGLVLTVLDEEYQISVYEGVKKRAGELGFELVCFQLETEELSKDKVISRITDKSLFSVDCVILLTSVIADNYEIKNSDDVEKIWGKVPVVSIGQDVKGIPSLMVKTENSIKELVSHLVEFHGYRKFLYISGAKGHQDSIVREKIFTETLESFKKTYNDVCCIVKEALFTEDSAIEAVQAFYSERPVFQPDVIICANDNMAIGVYKYFKMNHDNQDIKECFVTGFDDIPQSRFFIPSITTIRQPIAALSEKSVDVVKDVFEGKTENCEFFEESQVLYRESCGCTDAAKGVENDLFVHQLQKKYVRSENMLRAVTRMGQNMNGAQNVGGIRRVLAQTLAEFSMADFAVLGFNEGFFVDAIFVACGKQNITDAFLEKSLSLGDFYKCFMDFGASKSLIFKYLFSGDEIVGCILFDAKGYILPYIKTMGINIAQALARLKMMEVRQKYAENLEREVARRTEEAVEANKRRLVVEGEVLKISEMERQRFSNDLHDDICQRLAGISMLCRSYSNRKEGIKKDELIELNQLISETLQCTRQYAHNSYPVELERLGLNHALGNLCNSFSKQSGIKCIYEWTVPDSLTFSQLQALNVFRIVQEALHNVLKHSGAGEVNVSVEYTEQKRVLVCVADNGRGIHVLSAWHNVAEAEKNNDSETKWKKGLGLNSMQYRANQIDADFCIEPNVPWGIRIRVEFSL